MPFSTKKPEIPAPVRRGFLSRVTDSYTVCAATGAFVGLLISLLFM